MNDAPVRDAKAAEVARRAFESRGVIAELAAWRAAWFGEAPIRRPILVLFASTYPGVPEAAAAARDRLEKLAQGEGPINHMARQLGAGVEAFDLAIDRPVRDAAHSPAMSLRETAATLAFGMEALAKTPDVLILSDLSLKSERAATSLILGLTGAPAPHSAEGFDGDVKSALARARTASPETPIDWLAELGGREIAALVGAIIAARASGVPVIVDGLAALAAALVAHHIDPRASEHVICAAARHDVVSQAALAKAGLRSIFQETEMGSPGVSGLGVLNLIHLTGTSVQDD